ncbi:MAG TPA: hypothetical protein VFT06_15710, partial [Flavisolibacter sp.]|nr:hypothetical protein [Flavisolibacter sp.]
EKETVYTTTTIPAKQKKKGTVTVAGGMMAVLVVGGVFAASWIMNRHSNEEETVAAESFAAAPLQTETPVSAATKDDRPAGTPVYSASKKKQKAGAASTQTAASPKQNLPRKRRDGVVAGVPASGTNEYGTPPVLPKEEKPVITEEETSTAPAETTAPQEKKKKLRDKILDLFKKKPEEQKTEEAKPADNSNGERTATRREAGTNLAQMVSIRFDIPNDWMMGIKGAKAILVNRGSEKILKATVEVLYYNDDNELLQKKVITFSKIDGKESQTIAIPDHSTATRVDYNVLSVTGAGQPSA